MIQKLSVEIINKIAAGEVVQRPYNALKQLIQNSIDAEADCIHLKLQNGGLRKIEIKDNGKGIPLQDYPLLCERYATSKIKTITDLEVIQSFGFRGEALASLTHVAEVEVVSRHQSRKQAYYGKFENEKLINTPKQTKREVGTTITVQNLFSTLSSRRKSLTPNEQKKMIKELIFQMALNNPHIEFTLSTEKGEELLIDYKDYAEDDARLRIFCQLTGMIRQNCVYASEIIKGTKIIGIFSKINTWDKWRNIILTINHRIIDSPEIQKVIEKAYDEANRTIHKENYSYCAYLNISIDPRKIDCNIHPSKKQVSFYKSTELFFQMLKWMQKLLQQSGTVKFLDTGCRMSQHSLNQLQSRYQQKVLYPSQFTQQQKRNSNINICQMNVSQQMMRTSQQIPGNHGSQLSQVQQKFQYAFNKTRTDSKQLPLQYFYKNLIQGSSSDEMKKQLLSNQEPQYFNFKSFLDYHQLDETIKKQISEIKQFFLSVTYVGCFNSSHIFIQVGNKLYCFNVEQFIKVYVRELLKEKRSLYMKKVNNRQIRQNMAIPSILERFLLKHSNVMSQQKLSRIYNTTIQQLKFNRDYLEDKYGIKVNEILQVEAYPIIDKAFQTEDLREDSLIYFLIQLFGSNELEHKEDLNKLYLQFLSNPFYSLQSESEKYEISPHVDRYDSFFGHQLIPTMKMKAKFYKDQFDSIHLPDLLSEMMDLKDAYKMFERC